MKRLLFLTVLLCTFLSAGYAQTDTVEIRKNFWGTRYITHEHIRSWPMLKMIVENDASATRLINKGMRRYRLGITCFAVGELYLLVGLWAPSDNIIERNTRLMYIYGGAAVMALSIPIQISAHKHVKRAVRIYNANRQKASSNDYKQEFYFSFTGNSAGIIWRF